MFLRAMAALVVLVCAVHAQAVHNVHFKRAGGVQDINATASDTIHLTLEGAFNVE